MLSSFWHSTSLDTIQRLTDYLETISIYNWRAAYTACNMGLASMLAAQQGEYQSDLSALLAWHAASDAL